MINAEFVADMLRTIAQEIENYEDPTLTRGSTTDLYYSDGAINVQAACVAIVRRRAEEMKARYQGTPPTRHVPDLMLLTNLENAARTGQESGGTSFAVHHTEELELDRIVFYAWGNEAQQFAEAFNIQGKPAYMFDPGIGTHTAGIVEGLTEEASISADPVERHLVRHTALPKNEGQDR